MNRRRRIASNFLYAVALFLSLVGLAYSFYPRIMPYHERFLGLSHEQLEPKVAGLFLALLRVAGASFLSIGAGLALLVRGPFAKGKSWAWWVILVMSALLLLPLLVITIRIGWFTPWWGVAILIVLTAIALLLSRPPAGEA
jgi:hypothetical protein